MPQKPYHQRRRHGTHCSRKPSNSRCSDASHQLIDHLGHLRSLSLRAAHLLIARQAWVRPAWIRCPAKQRNQCKYPTKLPGTQLRALLTLEPLMRFMHHPRIHLRIKTSSFIYILASLPKQLLLMPQCLAVVVLVQEILRCPLHQGSHPWTSRSWRWAREPAAGGWESSWVLSSF